ncbi:MAG: hypothetical protein SPK00_07800 [Corynebacterium glucuronolyticum]|nr:hypothetical protein [Mycobacteriaceae bacterium]MDY5834635.1 hypothetical protein [Corynebacterium glucuronolyticum]
MSFISDINSEAAYLDLHAVVEGTGPYERSANHLASTVQNYLDNYETAEDLEAARILVEIAKVHAILNLTDELTRFSNCHGFNINPIEISADVTATVGE